MPQWQALHMENLCTDQASQLLLWTCCGCVHQLSTQGRGSLRVKCTSCCPVAVAHCSDAVHALAFVSALCFILLG